MVEVIEFVKLYCLYDLCAVNSITTVDLASREMSKVTKAFNKI